MNARQPACTKTYPPNGDARRGMGKCEERCASGVCCASLEETEENNCFGKRYDGVISSLRLGFSAKHITDLHSFNLEARSLELYNTNLVSWELYISQDGSWIVSITNGKKFAVTFDSRLMQSSPL